MANALYDFGRNEFLLGDIDWVADDVRIVFVDEADDTIDLAADDFLDDRAAGARVATSGALQNKSASAGVADADDITVSTVTGDQFESIDGYLHTGNEATATLIFNIDTATGLPCTPNGGNITVAWDSGANKILKL